MSLLHPTTTLARRAIPRALLATRAPLTGVQATASPFSTCNRLLASSSYGSGDGDPKGENPQDQGPQKSSDLEHPGPPPPDAGKGTGGGPTKASEGGHHGGSEVSGSGSGGEGEPRIHRPQNPSESGTKSEEVERHNAEFEKRHDRSANAAGEQEKVDSKFWKGQGGADREP